MTGFEKNRLGRQWATKLGHGRVTDDDSFVGPINGQRQKISAAGRHRLCFLKFTLPLALIWWGISLALLNQGHCVAQTVSDRAPDLAQIIKDLKSQYYAQRQRAARQLFDLGPQVLPELAGVERSSNADFNRRIDNLKVVLSAMRAGQGSSAARRAWLDFRDASFETRVSILEKLLRLEEYETHFVLMEQLSAPQIQEIFEDNRYFNGTFIELCHLERWDLIGRLLSMPIMWRYHPEICGRYHFLMGTLDQQLQQLSSALGPPDQELDGWNPDLHTVIGLLTFKRRYNLAARHIESIKQPLLRFDAENRLLAVRGDWKTLAARAVYDDENYDPDQPRRVSTIRQYVLLKQAGEGTAAAKKAIHEIEDQQNESEIVDRELLATLYLTICDWQSAKKYIELEPDIRSFELLNILNRLAEMDELIGAGETFTSRKDWAKKELKKIEALLAPLEKKRSDPRAPKFREAQKAVIFYRTVCKHWMELGLDHEAVLHLRKLFTLIRDYDQLGPEKRKVVETICEPVQPDLTWPFLRDAQYRPNELSELIGDPVLWGEEVPRTARQPGSKSALAQFLNKGLTDSVKEPFERLQRITFLLNSALQPQDPKTINKLFPNQFDLDTELASVKHDFRGDSCWQISLIYTQHQRFDEAKQWRQLAVTKGHLGALFATAEEAFVNEEYVKAAQLWDAHFKSSARFYSIAMSSHAWRLAGEEELAKRRMFYASTIPLSSSTTDFYGRFIEDDRGELVAELARLSICIKPTLEQDDYRLASECFKNIDPIESANLGKQRVLELELPNNINGYRWVARINILARTQEIMGAIEQGNFELTQSIFDQLNHFTQGSPSLVENIVPRLDELGQQELADYMTQQASAFFETTLTRYPNSANNRNNYAWLLACAQRQLDFMVRHAQTAIALRPDKSIYIDTLAETYFARGEYDQAIDTIKRAIALAPGRLYYRQQLRKFQIAKTKSNASKGD